MQVALTDITARKKAEAYLEYLGTHDVLTRTLNRSFFVDELNRLERKGPQPVTVIIADLNGLKAANDELGHARRRRAAAPRRRGVRLAGREAGVGRRGSAATNSRCCCPAPTPPAAKRCSPSLTELIELNNQFHPNSELSISTGIATSRPGDRLEQVVKRADMKMLHAKRLHYLQGNQERRESGAA